MFDVVTDMYKQIFSNLNVYCKDNLESHGRLFHTILSNYNASINNIFTKDMLSDAKKFLYIDYKQKEYETIIAYIPNNDISNVIIRISCLKNNNINSTDISIGEFFTIDLKTIKEFVIKHEIEQKRNKMLKVLKNAIE